jgi:hypothetical protein
MEAILRSASDPRDLVNVRQSNLPYRFDQIFSAEGFGARRLEKRRLKLMQQIDERVRSYLAEGEFVEFVSWGVEYSFFESYFMGMWAYLLNRRAVILTNRRILLIQISSRNRVLQLKSQIRYNAVAKFARATLGYIGLVTRDKKTHYLMRIPRKDRKQLRDRIAAHVDAVRSEAPVSGRENLCPHCGHRVIGLPERCSRCAKGFKSGAKAGWLSLVFPGLGDLYLGHNLLGLVEILGALFGWGLVAAAFLLPDEAGEVAEGGTAALVLLSVIAFVLMHGTDAWVTRRMGLKGIYPDSE